MVKKLILDEKNYCSKNLHKSQENTELQNHS